MEVNRYGFNDYDVNISHHGYTFCISRANFDQNDTRRFTRNATPVGVTFTRICMAAVSSALNIAYFVVYLIATVSVQ